MDNSNTSRIAKNTIMLYGRMLFSMLVSLYTSRVILAALGVEDYGIYNVVGGLVSMFSLISNSLSSAVSRFLNFELGKGNTDGLQKVFSTSLYIHLGLATIIVILAESVGIWFLNHQMNIPESRMYAANWVFQASLLSFVMNIISVPYNAIIVSFERLGAFAYIGIATVILKLFAVLIIAYTDTGFDKLIYYSILILLISIIIQVVYVVYCKHNFKKATTIQKFDRKLLRHITSFAGWNFIGCSAGVLKDQGINILLNIFFGPIVNAARGISNTVKSSVTAFVGNFMTALTPQITKNYASGNNTYLTSLILRGSRFSFYILLTLILPIILETETILNIWLKSYPEYTVTFVRLVLIISIIDTLSNTLITLQSATGNIRNYQIIIGGTLLLNFPISYIWLKCGLTPYAVYYTAIIISCICLYLRLLFLKQMEALMPQVFIKGVILNIIPVSLAALILPLILHITISNTICRFIIVVTVSLISTISSIYFIGCNKEERKFIHRKIISLTHATFRKSE